jgi:hypothetical protein
MEAEKRRSLPAYLNKSVKYDRLDVENDITVPEI